MSRPTTTEKVLTRSQLKGVDDVLRDIAGIAKARLDEAGVADDAQIFDLKPGLQTLRSIHSWSNACRKWMKKAIAHPTTTSTYEFRPGEITVLIRALRYFIHSERETVSKALLDARTKPSAKLKSHADITKRECELSIAAAEALLMKLMPQSSGAPTQGD